MVLHQKICKRFKNVQAISTGQFQPESISVNCKLCVYFSCRNCGHSLPVSHMDSLGTRFS